MPYDDGFNAINWPKMQERDYSDEESKSICMAECLSPNVVEAGDFFSVYVKSAEHEQQLLACMKAQGGDFHVNVNSRMFVNQ